MASGWYSKTIVDKVEIGNPLPLDYSVVGGIYGEEDIIANAETPVVTFTVPVDRLLEVYSASASSGTDTLFRFYIDGNLKEVKRNAWTERNVQFQIACELMAGQIVTITGEHHALIVHTMNATIHASLHDALG